MSAIAEIMSPDDNCFVRRAKRQTIIETWWRKGGIDDDQYRVLDALARDYEARLLSHAGQYSRAGNGIGSRPITGVPNDAACDRLIRLSAARQAIATLRDPSAWPLLELVLFDCSSPPVTSISEAARRVRLRTHRAYDLLRDCADVLNGLQAWRAVAQRTPIWALG